MIRKRLLSITLSLALVFGSAAALPEGVISESASITASAASTATSGKCGENVKWSLKNGVLTISGSGKMTDYFGDHNYDPFLDRTDIKSIVIKSGVTSIGGFAFEGCEKLTSVTIPSSVTSIGIFAFSHCNSLSSITIPKNVTSIGDNAFYNCEKLTSVIIPNSVTSIGSGAFYCTKWLENQQKKNPLVVVSGILIDGTNCSGKVTIPSSVKKINDSAFRYCEKLASVTIPSSVTSIGGSAFRDCEKLTSITIPSSVTSIGGYAFSETKWLENQQKKNPLVVVNGILIDGTKCSGKVTIPSSVKSIGDYAFQGCEKLTSITIPKSVTSIGYAAFAACNSLTSINIPSSVTSIGDEAFSYCSNLTSVTIPSSVKSIGRYAFSGTKWLENQKKKNPIVVVNRLLIDVDVEKCSGDVIVPDNVTNIGSNAFWNCDITSITIPKSVTSIGDRAFGYVFIYAITKIDGFIVKGYKGTAAEKYAKDNEFKFVALTETKNTGYVTANTIQINSQQSR